mmetsp:Transcript_16808/g.24871  ORF Transcript_16808/g.24871 Transcript_16808/m.24871 type:complete len:181 (+) Transcript_16808:25-567(+)
MTTAYGFDQPPAFFGNVSHKPLKLDFKESYVHVISEDEHARIIDDNDSTTREVHKKKTRNKLMNLVNALEICNNWHQIIPANNKVEKKHAISDDVCSSGIKISPTKSKEGSKKAKNYPKSVKPKTKKVRGRITAKPVWEGPADEEFLPSGWTKKVFQRNSGATKGRKDTYWYSPLYNEEI